MTEKQPASSTLGYTVFLLILAPPQEKPLNHDNSS